MKTPTPSRCRRVKTKQHPGAHRDGEAMWRGALLLCIGLFLQCWSPHSAAAETGTADPVTTNIRDLNDKSAQVRLNAAIALHNMGVQASSAGPQANLDAVD